MRLVIPVAIVVLGGLTLGGGLSLGLQTLSAYSADDANHVQSALRFRVWLRDTSRTHTGKPEQAGLARAIADRLLLSPVHVRREIVSALVADDFFDGVASDERRRQAMIAALREGVALALKSAPAAGDLWLAASYLETLTNGFGTSAEVALANSWLTAPRAAALAPARAEFALSVEPLLGVAGRAAIDSDIALVRAAGPSRALPLAGARDRQLARRP